MWSLRLSETGKLFFKFLLGAAGLATSEYYLYYRVMPQYALKKFRETKLSDKPEYAEEILLMNGSQKFIFKHRGGSQALQSIIRDTFDSKVFRLILAVQFTSAMSLCIGMAKQRMGLMLVGTALLATNLMLVYPTLHSSLGLLRLGEMVAQGNEEVWENLNEVRFIQRMEEAKSVEMQLIDHVGLYGTLILSFYCSPVLTSLTSGLVWLYLN